MNLIELGYSDALQEYRLQNNLDNFEVGRVISEHKERYTVKTDSQEFDSELVGNLRFMAQDRHDFPAVGDWVAISEYDDGKALIHAIFPRTSVIERKAVGVKGQIQIIATNIDYGIIVESVNRDFNINRVERYLTICNSSNVIPIIVISKYDLLPEGDINSIIESITKRIPNTTIVKVSSEVEDGYMEINNILEKGKTYCLLGSSGVGKSTLLNNISGSEIMETGEISSSVNKGKHTTSHRELVLIQSGALLIDNPGMREVGVTSSSEGVETTFDAILQYASDCKFSDCSHTNERGCAILDAVENGEIDSAAYENFMKLEREKSFFESSTLEKKQKDKDLGKMVKNVMKIKKQSKF